MTQIPWRDFFLGGVATSAACLFTNPAEVVKTRLQLQGELGLSNARPYKGVFDAFSTILRTEGIKGIQKGLIPATAYQFTMNGVRLGTYSVLKSAMATDVSPALGFAQNVGAAALAGVCGAMVGSPFFLIKIRMQSQSSTNQVGFQHHYSSTRDAFRQIWRQGGFRGLMKGVDAAAIRVASGSSVQLPTYDIAKRSIINLGIFDPDSIIVHFTASLMTGMVVVTFMNPFDVVSTRLYNEQTSPDGRGLLYRGPIDCFIKTAKSEGIRGLYKGSLAHYLRIGPHTILTFVFFEQLKLFAKKIQ
eukprot:TRINITY_DN19692_c0_g1_i1.p1 TRINITY_DN19692_c0_g1~~TRINITY_DN19692_c0_g1_i1.p1  ORF type:complete len:302 (+),score=67.74 TRINITY_DN19692_c0_g1_i1:3-908(+)